jgi:hypothetical protein
MTATHYFSASRGHTPIADMVPEHAGRAADKLEREGGDRPTIDALRARAEEA